MHVSRNLKCFSWFGPPGSLFSDYEASLKKEGGIPDGPVLESLLAGEALDKKVETKEEEPMSECQVRQCVIFLNLITTAER